MAVTAQQDWVHKVAIVIIAGVALYMLQAMAGSIGEVQTDLADHETEAAGTYVSREELVSAMDRVDASMVRLEKSVWRAIRRDARPD